MTNEQDYIIIRKINNWNIHGDLLLITDSSVWFVEIYRKIVGNRRNEEKHFSVTNQKKISP